MPNIVKRLGRGPNNNSGGGRVATPMSPSVGTGGGSRPSVPNTAGGKMRTGSAPVGMGAGMTTPKHPMHGRLPTKGRY